MSEELKAVEADTNAVSAADRAIDAMKRRLVKAQAQGLKSKELDELIDYADKLRSAVAANIEPGTSGPVGKTPAQHRAEGMLKEANDLMAQAAHYMALAGEHAKLAAAKASEATSLAQ